MLLGRAATLALAPELARASPAGAFAAELLDALDAEAADVLVIDFMLAGAIAAAERTRLPTAASCIPSTACRRRGDRPSGQLWRPEAASPLACATPGSPVSGHRGGGAGYATSTTRASVCGCRPSRRRTNSSPTSTGSW
jgi:hypothetical protein